MGEPEEGPRRLLGTIDDETDAKPERELQSQAERDEPGKAVECMRFERAGFPQTHAQLLGK